MVVEVQECDLVDPSMLCLLVAVAAKELLQLLGQCLRHVTLPASPCVSCLADDI